MKLIQKYLSIFLFTALLLLVILLCLKPEKISLPCFQVPGADTLESEPVEILDGEDGNYYVFLPSYTDMSRVTVSVEKDNHFSLGGHSLSDGMDCGIYELETAYDFAVNGEREATLWFYRSANVATMYINTASGNMEAIHHNKNYEENASILVYTENGSLDCEQVGRLKGRGNSTWRCAKRPYSLTLGSDTELLGMAMGEGWNLLANVADETHLNNKLVFDLAARVGIPWAPDCRFVDLYLNGEYNGLYLVTEKPEVHENRLDIGSGSGNYLYRIDMTRRWDRLRNPFISESGRTMELGYPLNPSDREKAEAQKLVNQMERTLSSEKDLQAEPTIDLDSWVRRYLIDEVTANADGDHASAYFYHSDGVFYAGPIWDYDLAFGNVARNRDPGAFIARNYRRSDTVQMPYYGWLCANESFQERVKEIYKEEFSPVLHEMLNGEIDRLAEQISKAVQVNSLRWNVIPNTGQRMFPNLIHTPQELEDYLYQRVRFLDSAWIDNTQYCSVQLELNPGEEYRNATVQKGSVLETEYIDLEGAVWIDCATGEPFDFSQPIVADMLLSREGAEGITEGNAEADEEQEDSESLAVDTAATRDYIALMSIALLLFMLAGFALTDRIRRRKERRAADER